jgi:hypothetical protein
MTGAQQAQRTAAYRWVILVAMCLIGFMTVGTRSTVSSFLKTITTDLGTNRETISFILRRRKPRPLGVVRDKRLCLTKVLGLKALGHCLGTNSSKTGRAAVAAFIS